MTATGYETAFSALVCSALGVVLTKKISGRFDKTMINFFLGISITVVAVIKIATTVAESAESNDTTAAVLAHLFPTGKGAVVTWVLATLVGLMGMAQQACLICKSIKCLAKFGLVKKWREIQI